VAAGGDGTVSAVISGVVGTTVLSALSLRNREPARHELGIPLEIEDAVALIAGAYNLERSTR